MLCAGIIHGDLSEYNILVGAEGPVIIDLPQAVDAAGNRSSTNTLNFVYVRSAPLSVALVGKGIGHHRCRLAHSKLGQKALVHLGLDAPVSRELID